MKLDFPEDIEGILKLVGRAADQLGYPCYAIGGFIRDFLLGKHGKDIDFTCEGDGIKLAEKVASLVNHQPQLVVFKTFGTAQLKFDGWNLEFVGARKESYSRNSRNPHVSPGTLADDFARRDFTINTIAVCCNENRFGELTDPFNGLEDLKNRLIRTPQDPEVTFSDDPLRMLRAIRFATILRFEIEPHTWEGIKKNAGRIEIVSQERITDELNKILMAEQPSRGFKLLFDSGLLKIIFPELARLQGVEEKDGYTHKDNFYHTLEVLDNVARKNGHLWLRWAALLHDIAKPDTKRFEPGHGWTFHGHDAVGARKVPRIFKRMRLPLNEKMRYVQKLVALHLRPIALAKDEITDSAVRRLLFEAGDDIEDLMLLCEADITSKNEYRKKRFLANFRKVRQRLKEIEEKDRIRNFQPPVSGEIIMKVFNLKPCKTVGIIKSKIKDAILDGIIHNNYEEAFNLMLKIGKEMGLKPVSENPADFAELRQTKTQETA